MQEKPLSETVREPKEVSTETIQELGEPSSETLQESEESSSETLQESEESSSETLQESEESSTEMSEEPEETLFEALQEPEESSFGTSQESETSSTEVSEEPSSETAQEPSSESVDKPEETTQGIVDSETTFLQPETVQEERETLYSVSFPAKTKAYLDPGNVSGEGQVFSEHYKVENYGNTDVSIKIKNISIQCLSDQDIYMFTEEDVIDPRSVVKKLHIDMVWENGDGQEKILHISDGVRDEEVLSLKAASYDKDGNFVSVMDGGSGSFYFTGAMNGNPGLQWEDGEIVITFSYEITEMRAETH